MLTAPEGRTHQVGVPLEGLASGLLVHDARRPTVLREPGVGIRLLDRTEEVDHDVAETEARDEREHDCDQPIAKQKSDDAGGQGENHGNRHDDRGKAICLVHLVTPRRGCRIR